MAKIRESVSYKNPTEINGNLLLFLNIFNLNYWLIKITNLLYKKF